jgi:hypothetical protein
VSSPSGSLDLTYFAQYDSNGVVEPTRPDIIQRKASDADVVSAVLSVETPTPSLTISIQISLGACKDGGKAYETRNGGALREVSFFSWFTTYARSELSILIGFTGLHYAHEEIKKWWNLPPSHPESSVCMLHCSAQWHLTLTAISPVHLWLRMVSRSDLR